MLSKCANPGCSASFLYLHQGKLFRLETSGNGDDTRGEVADPPGKHSSRRLEYFWLYAERASLMPVRLKPGVRVMRRPRYVARKAAADHRNPGRSCGVRV